jgi:hypothetical protein
MIQSHVENEFSQACDPEQALLSKVQEDGWHWQK